MSYFVTEFARDSEEWKILRVVGHGFFTLVVHKVFHVKILMFIIFRYNCLLLCQRSVSKINQTDSSRKVDKNIIHPPPCVLYSKVNTSPSICSLSFHKLAECRNSLGLQNWFVSLSLPLPYYLFLSISCSRDHLLW